MAVRRGKIVAIEGPGLRGKFCRVTLDTGSRVYISVDGMNSLVETYRAEDELVFVETGLLGRVSWVGTDAEYADAMRAGRLSSQ